MICTICSRKLTLCICDDAEDRIRKLKHPNLAIDGEAILAERFLNKFEIERIRKEGFLTKRVIDREQQKGKK